MVRVKIGLALPENCRCVYENGYSKIYYFQCQKCEFAGRWKEQLIRHMNNVHDYNITYIYQVTSEKTIKCDLCDFKARDKGNLDKHHLAKHVEEDFSCALCDYTSKYKQTLQGHMNKVHLKKFPCAGCKEYFQSNYKLKFHQAKCNPKAIE